MCHEILEQITGALSHARQRESKAYQWVVEMEAYTECNFDSEECINQTHTLKNGNITLEIIEDTEVKKQRLWPFYIVKDRTVHL